MGASEVVNPNLMRWGTRIFCFADRAPVASWKSLLPEPLGTCGHNQGVLKQLWLRRTGRKDRLSSEHRPDLRIHRRVNLRQQEQDIGIRVVARTESKHNTIIIIKIIHSNIYYLSSNQFLINYYIQIAIDVILNYNHHILSWTQKCWKNKNIYPNNI